MNSPIISSAISHQVKKAREASLVLANLDNSAKNKILNDLAGSLRENFVEILERIPEIWQRQKRCWKVENFLMAPANVFY